MRLPTGACHKNSECGGNVQRLDREKTEWIRMHRRPTFRRPTAGGVAPRVNKDKKGHGPSLNVSTVALPLLLTRVTSDIRPVQRGES